MTDAELKAIVDAAVKAEREAIAAFVDDEGDPILAALIRAGAHRKPHVA